MYIFQEILPTPSYTQFLPTPSDNHESRPYVLNI